MVETLKKKAKHKFPLYLHKTGQWCKKHKGRTFYAGTDKDTALQRYVDEWEDWKAGRLVRERRCDSCSRSLQPLPHGEKGCEGRRRSHDALACGVSRHLSADHRRVRQVPRGYGP